MENNTSLVSEDAKHLKLTFGFSTGNCWTSKLIRWVTRSKVSHAWIAFNFLGIRLFVGADETGLSFCSEWRFKRTNKVMAEFSRAEDLTASLKWFINLYAGTEYDFGAAGATGIKDRFVKLWKRFGAWLRKKLSSGDKLICTEVLVRIFQHAELPEFTELDPETTDAQILLTRCMKSCKLIYIDPTLKECMPS